MAFGLTILLIPITIVLVKLGRLFISLARRIEDHILPASIREEIETGIAAGVAAGINKAVDKATSETRNQVNAAWQEWLARRDLAQDQGIPFNEPPPSEMTALE